MWCRDVTEILESNEDRLEGMRGFEQKSFKELNELAALVRGKPFHSKCEFGNECNFKDIAFLCAEQKFLLKSFEVQKKICITRNLTVVI